MLKPLIGVSIITIGLLNFAPWMTNTVWAQQTPDLIKYDDENCGGLYYDIMSSDSVVFYFDLSETGSLHLRMERLRGEYEYLSADLDPYLVLLDENGNVLAENDDFSEHDINSQIEISELYPGRYYIVAGAYSGSGRFLLMKPACGGPLGDGSDSCNGIRVVGALPDHRSPDWTSYNGFHGLVGESIQITMRSRTKYLVPSIELYGPEDAPNQVSYHSANLGNRTASIRITLQFEGYYVIRAYGLNGTTGRYTLTCKLIR